MLNSFRSIWIRKLNIKKSISLKINIILSISIIFIITVLGCAYFLSERSKEISKIRNSAEQAALRVAGLFSTAGDRLKISDITNVLQIEMSDKNMLAIIINDANTNSVLSRDDLGLIKDSYWNIKEFDSSLTLKNRLDKSFFVSKKKIFFNNMYSGWVEVYITDFFQNQYLKNLIVETIINMMLLAVVLLLIINLTVNKFIIKPVIDLNNSIMNFNSKNFRTRAMVSTRDELGSLSKSFNKMAELLQHYNEEMLKQLYTDSLTGLPNRYKILVDIEVKESPALILINIDFFKEINDFYGNRIGDMVLKEMTFRLRALQTEYNYQLYRMPADEFALLFDCCIEIKRLEEILRHLGEDINERPFLLEDNEINVRMTCGVARGEDILIDKIIEGKWRNLATNADMALKKAKKLQKNFIIYSDSMEIPKEYENNILWKKRLKEAIKNHRIVPYFQPIVNNINGKIEKYECLVRLIDGHGNIIAPRYFLEVAKKSHLYSDITSVMLDKTLGVFKDTEFDFSINLTIHDTDMDEEMNYQIKKKIKENYKIADKIIFEILESEGIENYKEVMVFIEEVKEHGCKIAIDDFGSGYSNFEHILRLSVDYIKIDASLIKNIDIDPNAQIIAKTIANFSKELGLKTISEYVHSKSVFDKGVELGIDYSQGYYFGEPKEYIMLEQ